MFNCLCQSVCPPSVCSLILLPLWLVPAFWISVYTLFLCSISVSLWFEAVSLRWFVFIAWLQLLTASCTTSGQTGVLATSLVALDSAAGHERSSERLSMEEGTVIRSPKEFPATRPLSASNQRKRREKKPKKSTWMKTILLQVSSEPTHALRNTLEHR